MYYIYHHVSLCKLCIISITMYYNVLVCKLYYIYHHVLSYLFSWSAGDKTLQTWSIWTIQYQLNLNRDTTQYQPIINRDTIQYQLNLNRDTTQYQHNTNQFWTEIQHNTKTIPTNSQHRYSEGEVLSLDTKFDSLGFANSILSPLECSKKDFFVLILT